MVKSIRVFDAGEQFADRYTVEITYVRDSWPIEIFGMSQDATMPNGFNRFIGIGKVSKEYSFYNSRVKFRDLPKKTKQAIKQRIKDAMLIYCNRY